MNQASTSATKAIRRPSFPWGVVILYVFIGPIIGNAVIALISGATLFTTDLSALNDVLSGIFLFFMMGLMFCHLMGGIQALLCGVAAALWQRKRGQLPYSIAALFGVIVGLGFIFIVTPDSFPMSSIFIVVHVVAVLGCNYLTRKSKS
ncbi:MAG: hypothetical protein LAT77_03490 [Aliidiomarina sp.]|uniref:hypothetical protein n=1 Tax=Aliidiomarina sp. TaxID=1872439 RepID=UPI0025C0A3DB|nr:hypothetical protein [Aliidiomarina sp.]MCH8500960.1 hypothetical protein [Aliidiomarina sp.]